MDELQNVRLRRGNKRLRRVAVGALIAWAFVASIAVVSLAVQASRDHAGVTRANQALRVGCAADNAIIAYVDKAHRVLHSGLMTAVLLEGGLARAGSRRDRAIRSAGVRRFHQAADSIRYLPSLDCRLLTDDPQAYTVPQALPFK